MAISAGALYAFAAILAVAEGINASDDAQSTLDKFGEQLSHARDEETMSENEMSSLSACHISEGESCPYSSMTRGQSTLVYPGGKTRCLSASEPDFAFQVIPGDPDKVAIFFQGGGVCWNDYTSGVACSTSVRPNRQGIFDLDRGGNPLFGYTLVTVLYCSGDFHMGSVDNAWGPQHGWENTFSALSWVRDNFFALDSLLIAGSSAGALAVQLLSGFILKFFDGVFVRATVIADSFAGVFPQGFESVLSRQFGYCQTPPVTKRGSAFVTQCQAGKFTVQDQFKYAMLAFPAVPFASIQSKTNWVQILLFNLIVYVEPAFKFVGPIEGIKFYILVNDIFLVYDKQPNYISYLVNLAWHDFLEFDELYTTDPSGELNRGVVAKPLLTDWLTGLFADPTVGQGPNEGGPSGSVCLGVDHPRSFWIKKLAGVLYCDAGQRGKVLSLQDYDPAPSPPAARLI